jgi:phenylpropionate dioxygenase-like ring-hydroxylating dioxygenase large terminal subunit
MITAEENELLTRTGKETPMGQYFRRFWLPALLSEEVPAPDCPPVEVTIMGEHLIAFRDTNGEVGLIQPYCPHRQAPLFYGRNEQNGLRCIYHGWKFNVHGQCVDIPSEANGEKLKGEVRITSYPCKEYAGIVWAYLGPKDLPVEFPVFEFNSLPQNQIYIRKSLLESNYLQNLEGQFDSTHIGFLHSFLARNGSAPAVGGISLGSSEAAQTVLDVIPNMEVRETGYGFMLAAKRPAAQGRVYCRVTQWLLPVHTMIANPPGETLLWDAWVPMDDEHTWVYRISYNPWRSINEKEIFEFNNAGLMPMSVQNIPGTYLPLRNKRNHYQVDRNLQRSYSYSGIKGNNAQDAAIMENQGPTPIYDRTKEFLGTSDIGIVMARRRLLKVVRELQDGVEPEPALDGDMYNVRPIAVFFDNTNGKPFYEQEEVKKYIHL